MKKWILTGIAVVLLLIGLSLSLFWGMASKETRSEISRCVEYVVDDCEAAETLAIMGSQAGEGYRPWSNDPCGEMTAVECEILFLRASIKAGCVHETLADCGLGEVLFLQDNYSEAIEPLESCSAKVDAAQYLWYLGVSYHNLGFNSKAEKIRQELARVREKYPDRVDDILGSLPY